MKKGVFAGLCVLILGAGLYFRVIDLDGKPMHPDEANQAVKFGALLVRGEYRYDPADHHGPSLYYLSLPWGRLAAGRDFTALDETDLRLIPALFGWGVVGLILALMRPLGRGAALGAGALAALSPAAVYYSRCFIQETLLVFFTAGLILAGWKYRVRPSGGRAAAAGFFAGMMFATKETSLILFAALAGAVFLAALSGWPSAGSEIPRRRVHWDHGAVFIGAAALTALLLFSSFLTFPRGAVDCLSAFTGYLRRAGEAGWHSHSWSYYLGILAWFKRGGGPVWSEALILGLGLWGAAAAFRRSTRENPGSPLLRVLVFYTLLATAAYSLIPYKTPWNLLPFHLGWLCLAGWGAARLAGEKKNRLRIPAAILVLALGLAHLGRQSGLAVSRYAADPRNPYVYAQTSRDFLNLVRRVNGLAAVHPEGRDMLIRVVAGPYLTWPLPWYLRSFARVGYWPGADAAGDVAGTPVILASVEASEKLSPDLESDYISEYYGLRPEVLMVLWIRRDLWESFLRERSR